MPGLITQRCCASLAVLLATSTLLGCVAKMPSPPATDRFLVESVQLTHRVTFEPGAQALGAAEHYRLAAFLDETDPDGRAEIYLDAAGPDGAGRIDDVGAALRELGRQTTGSSVGAGSEYGVTLTLLQSVVLPEACLSGDGWPDPRLSPGGCSQALSLAQMVEDPDDLLRGRTMGPASAARAADAAGRLLARRASGDEPVIGDDGAAVPSGQALPPPALTQGASY